MKSIVQLTAAKQEAIDAAVYLESRSRGLGVRFMGALDDALDAIAGNPSTGFIHNRDTRMRLVKGFPYGVVFAERSDAVYVLAVAHLHRRPTYWADRLKDIPNDQ